VHCNLNSGAGQIPSPKAGWLDRNLVSMLARALHRSLLCPRRRLNLIDLVPGYPVQLIRIISLTFVATWPVRRPKTISAVWWL